MKGLPVLFLQKEELKKQKDESSKQTAEINKQKEELTEAFNLERSNQYKRSTLNA